MFNTKRDFCDCLKEILNPLKDFFTEAKAGIKCGATGVQYGEETALLEAFARPLWGLAPLWAGEEDIEGFDKIYIQGIANGTNPGHEEYWGKIGDSRQRIVETAPIGLALMLSPEKIWDPLTEAEKKNLHRWLCQVNSLENSGNWLFFPIFVNLGLKRVGMEYDEKLIKDSLKKIDSYYVGNGWYTDGNTKQLDYYIPFAFHFYGLIYAKFMEKEDPEHSRIFKERAMLFAKDFIYYFDSDGSSIPFGRSLTYRFAQCCFWSACVYAEIEPFSMGVMKGIISRHLKYWFDKPIFDNGGIMTIGYGYPNLNMSEGYNAFGSPYWSLKAFLLLALPENHKFFKTEALDLPELDSLKVLKEPGFVIQRTGGYVTAISSGKQQVDWFMVFKGERYSKFAYSTRFAFSVPRSYEFLQSAATDSMLTFIKDGMCHIRKTSKESWVEEDGRVYSRWSPCEGLEVETYIIPTDRGHIRKHIINCEEEIVAYDCSFATPCGGGKISGDGENVRVTCVPNTNLIYSNPTQMESVKYQLKKGKNVVETVVEYPIIK